MKQVLQNLKTGATDLGEVPCPQVKAGHLLIRSHTSVVSAGTERMLVEFGKANLLEKARQQPDKVRMVLDKVKTDGLLPTLGAVQSKLDQPLPLGYSNAGSVLEIGAGVDGFSVGDRVVSNGHHAEVVCAPKNLCVKIPGQVGDDAAAFTVIGAIALQGIRLAQPTLGEAFVVTGLGLIGLITVQLLQAQGCRVLAIDFDPERLQRARQFGAETVDLSGAGDPVAAALSFSRGRGVDGVIITASTKSNEPIHQAALSCRKRGRIVLVGVVGLELSRADFYEKELSFQVSCSYGPGRYDPLYEKEGRDYPFGYVRWTERRNFEAVLDMMAEGRLSMTPLISHRFQIDQAERAYKALAEDRSSLGILLQYADAATKPNEFLRIQTISTPLSGALPSSSDGIGFVGAGNYATQSLIPSFKKAGATLYRVASANGVSAAHAARKFGFHSTTTDTDSLISDKGVDAVVIATRHDSHARLVCQALKEGKHLFVEKPLAIDRGQLAEIEAAYSASSAAGPPPLLMVGFNRRFAPQIVKAKALLADLKEPKSFILTVNAGMIPPDHWTQDPDVGGGRIIGEGCHFIDLLRFLAGAPIVSTQAMKIGGAAGTAVCDDKVTFTLLFSDGSVGSVHYMANGHRSFPKERLQIFCAGRVLEIDNFREMRGYGWPKFTKMKLWRQDKGNAACAAAFMDAVRQGKPSPIPYEELIEVTRVSFEIVESLQRSC